MKNLDAISHHAFLNYCTGCSISMKEKASVLWILGPQGGNHSFISLLPYFRKIKFEDQQSRIR